MSVHLQHTRRWKSCGGRDRLSVDRHLGSCEGNRPETPPHWEGLEAGQQLWPHEKEGSRRVRQNGWRYGAQEHARVLHRWAPSPRQQQSQRWPHPRPRHQQRESMSRPFHIPENSLMSRKMHDALAAGKYHTNLSVVEERRRDVTESGNKRQNFEPLA